MQVFILSLVFLVLLGVSNFLVNRFVMSRIPKRFVRSKLVMRIAAYVFAFIGTLFIMNWGTGITVIQTSQGVRISWVRWLWWILSAIFFGVASLLLSRADHIAQEQEESARQERDVSKAS